MFDNRLEVIFDYFDSTRSQILLQRQTVPQLGGLRDDPWQNFGKVRNRGVDMSVNAHQNIGKVKLSARGTFTFTRNKILEYDELPPKYDYQAITGKRVSDKDNLYYIAERLYTEDDFTISTNANGLKTYPLYYYLFLPKQLINGGDTTFMFWSALGLAAIVFLAIVYVLSLIHI